MRDIMIGAITLAASAMVISACTTTETRVVQTPAVVGAAPGSSTTVIRSNRTNAPVVVESDEPRNIIVHVD
jgi:hypothetical protein